MAEPVTYKELWSTTKVDGKQNRLVAQKVNDAQTKLTLSVVKPGNKWSFDQIVPFTIEQLIDAHTWEAGWKDDWKYEETNGVFRAMRSIAIPTLQIKLYWSVTHIKVVGDTTSFIIDDRFRCCPTLTT